MVSRTGNAAPIARAYRVYGDHSADGIDVSIANHRPGAGEVHRLAFRAGYGGGCAERRILPARHDFVLSCGRRSIDHLCHHSYAVSRNGARGRGRAVAVSDSDDHVPGAGRSHCAGRDICSVVHPLVVSGIQCAEGGVVRAPDADTAAGAVVFLCRWGIWRGSVGAETVQRAGGGAADLWAGHHCRWRAVGAADRCLLAGHRHGGGGFSWAVPLELDFREAGRYALPPDSGLARQRAARVGAVVASAYGRRLAGDG